MKNFNYKILIAGEGGQGVQAIGEILNMAVYKEGFNSIYIPNYGVEQRGGVSLAYVQISDSPIPYPKFKIADILAVLCKRAIPRVSEYYNRKTKIINGISFVEKPDEHNLSSRTYNMIILGILSEFLPLKKETILKVMEEKFKKIPSELLKQNKQAFLIGRGLGLRLPTSATKLKPIKIKDKGKHSAQFAENKKIKLTISAKYCKSCGICITRCPVSALYFSKIRIGVYGAPAAEVDISKCISCGLCERVCPDTAIEIKKKEAKRKT